MMEQQSSCQREKRKWALALEASTWIQQVTSAHVSWRRVRLAMPNFKGIQEVVSYNESKGSSYEPTHGITCDVKMSEK